MAEFDFEEIKLLYKRYYNDPNWQARQRLPYYEIQPWDKVLNKVEARAFEDIRFMGIPLYPIFPISETSYLHFANPFAQIGIEIVYKNSPQALVTRKIELLEAQGWKIYTINSTAVYHTIEEFFRIKRKQKDVEWEDLTQDVKFKFVEKYLSDNIFCLLWYIDWNHFQRMKA